MDVEQYLDKQYGEVALSIWSGANNNKELGIRLGYMFAYVKEVSGYLETKDLVVRSYFPSAVEEAVKCLDMTLYIEPHIKVVLLRRSFGTIPTFVVGPMKYRMLKQKVASSNTVCGIANLLDAIYKAIQDDDKALRQLDRELSDADTRCATCYYSGGRGLTDYCGMGHTMHTGNCTHRVPR